MLFKRDINTQRDAMLQPLVLQHNSLFVDFEQNSLYQYLKAFNFPKKHETPIALHFRTNGKYSLHNIAIQIANKIGPCECIISTFNISEMGARFLLTAHEKGSFSNIEIIANIAKRHNFIKACKMLEKKIPITYHNIHAKIAVLWNDNYHISLVHSGNMSKNHNFERGTIFTDALTFDYDYQFLRSLTGAN
jgi:hypothetical protein